ncbi:MAG: YbhB/YbcL family Raf kinase inhibitor-like protein [Candidatus Omnitrophica bacterium]|nr:YbhB/YbcL family Raf kinase inhibitor-like protein [Candidatus Omnitrophota bacterium]MBD3269083.1 YbhB/YbcL family Raf kinase inhibitor-like protein [Candidatus Omnitrophota bacterium]
MRLSSPEFRHNQMIPKKFTCQGEDLSPALVLEDVPPEARSLVLIVDDPDAPMKTWVHWVVYNIPPSVSRIEEGSVAGKQGVNDFNRTNYGGPCPPSGTHRYFFKAYALDTELDLDEGKSKAEVEKAMEGHVIQQAELIGLYRKQ